ncbi:hypothetical protein D9M71_759310 [compost metagenome]
MTVAQLMAGQGGSQQHQRIRVALKFVQERDERFVQRTQPATLDPTSQQYQQVIGAGQRRKPRQAVGCERYG